MRRWRKRVNPENLDGPEKSIMKIPGRILSSKGFLHLVIVVMILWSVNTWVLGQSRLPEPPDPPGKTVAASQGPATTPADTSGQSGTQKYFTDVVLINQNGQKMRFYSDVLQGKVVVINSFFATCQGSCLPMSRNLEKVQEALGDHLGKDVYIVSISVDPTVDTPASEKSMPGSYMRNRDGSFSPAKKQTWNSPYASWAASSRKDDHLNIFIIGNERTRTLEEGLWPGAQRPARQGC